MKALKINDIYYDFNKVIVRYEYYNVDEGYKKYLLLNL